MPRHIDISLDGLHGLLHRLERKELVDGDWAVCSALVLQLIAKIQGKQERMATKLKAQGAGAVPAGQASSTPCPSPRVRCRRAAPRPAPPSHRPLRPASSRRRR